MLTRFVNINNRLVYKLILSIGVTLLIAVAAAAYSFIQYHQKTLLQNIIQQTDSLTADIQLEIHKAMMLDSRHELIGFDHWINTGKLKELENIRITNKEGVIKHSVKLEEINNKINKLDKSCNVCHNTEPPLAEAELNTRTRILHAQEGYRQLGIISPIYNEAGCYNSACHVHPPDQKLLGTIDMVISLNNHDIAISNHARSIVLYAVFFLLAGLIVICFFLLQLLHKPLEKIINRIRLVGKNLDDQAIAVGFRDETEQILTALNHIIHEINHKEAELSRLRNEYENLFEHAPCMITVQDKQFRLLRYNLEFVKQFNPTVGDFCYRAYKGLEHKCTNCPVEKTFIDGKAHHSEEIGVNKDGTASHWISNTSPIYNEAGEIVAAMEMSLDITQRKYLEKQLQKSERKYHDIFNNIPNPVFVLDYETLKILDCNQSVYTNYGYQKQELINRLFLELFAEDDKIKYTEKLKACDTLNQIKHKGKEGNILVVNIRVSFSDYQNQKVLLITTSDITKRLEAEQQLIQASKLATLGEMASGIAHELNQPLSVIKTTTSFFIRKIEKTEIIDSETFSFMMHKADKNIDRATKIINHMRQFSRKSEMMLQKVYINDILKNAFEIFSQQLKIRGIEVVWDLEDNMPRIMAEPNRLEQVFINLLLNARDAIEEQNKLYIYGEDKTIKLITWMDQHNVYAEIRDTGTGFSNLVANKMFEPFFTTKKVGQGTGLGLSISYGIIKECGGQIQAVSRENGASFILNFPIVRKS